MRPKFYQYELQNGVIISRRKLGSVELERLHQALATSAMEQETDTSLFEKLRELPPSIKARAIQSMKSYLAEAGISVEEKSTFQSVEKSESQVYKAGVEVNGDDQ